MAKYYIRHIHTYGRATSMEKQLMHFCKEKVGFVLSEDRLLAWVEQIRDRQREIRKNAPRIKPVEISISRTVFGADGYSSIRIGEGYVGLDIVKGEEL